MTISLSSLSSR